MLSSLRQVTFHGVGSKTKNNIQASNFEADRNVRNRAEMAGVNAMTEPITQAAIETTKAVVQAVAVVTAEVGTWPICEPGSMKPKLGGPTLQHPTFNSCATYKYAKLGDFTLEINKIFLVYNVKYQLLNIG